MITTFLFVAVSPQSCAISTTVVGPSDLRANIFPYFSEWSQWHLPCSISHASYSSEVREMMARFLLLLLLSLPRDGRL
jgi:hypothetical protein